jgi:hypothetical protein
MKFIWPWQRKKQADLNTIEKALESIYTPVKANPAFNDDLRNRLVGAPEAIRNAGASTLRLFMMIGGGLIGLVLFVFGIVRSVLALITGFRLVGDRRKARKTQAPPPPHTKTDA